MEHIPQGITIVTGPDFQVRMVSKYGRELAGLQREQTEGIPFDQHLENLHLLDPEDESEIPLCDLPLARAIDLGEVSRNVELIMDRPNGQKIPLLLHAGPIRDEKGEVVGGVVAWQDITERKRAEQALQTYARKLERSNRDLQDFAFIASHDLQEPLRKVQSFGDRLAERYQLVLDAEGLDFLNRMRNAAVRMQKMVNDLLAYSRVMTKPEPFAEVDLNRVVEQAVSDLELRVESSAAQIEVSDLPVIEADGIQMQQLFQNLLGNAIKFHQPGFPPMIKIFCRTTASPQSKDQGFIEVIVQDEGIGFDEKYLDRIFQPFQRLHGQSKFDGSGIGLAVCRKIVERHSGSITAHSKPGQGASFIVKLPVHQKEEISD